MMFLGVGGGGDVPNLLRFVHTWNNSYKDNCNFNDISVHTDQQQHKSVLM